MMIAQLAENAILTKSRAMYAKRITPQDYSELLACKSVGDVAAFLKNRTVYARALEGVNPSLVHRGWLESALNEELMRQYEALCHYEFSLGRSFYEYFIIQGDISQISRCASLISAGHTEEYLLQLPDFYSKHSRLDLYAMAKVRTPEELLRSMENSPYYKACAPFMKKETQRIDMPGLDAALTRFSFEDEIAKVKRLLSGKAKKDFLQHIAAEIDIYNITALYRVKHFKKNDLSHVLSLLVTQGGSLHGEIFQKMMNAANEEDLLKLVQATHYGRFFQKEDFEYIESASQHLRYKQSKKDLRFSTNPLIVMMAYTYLLQNEVTNIIHIIEGIRYSLPADEIGKLLIGAKD